MRPPRQDIANRCPVWVALSDLYLDTELYPDDLELLAETLAASPYTTDELKHILLAEVHPACMTNLRQVAGVWSGFDPVWLRASILGRTRAAFRWPARLFRFRNATLARAAPLFARVAELRRS
jgi:hypothetical protein